jgi:hypothetical protein
VAFAPPVCTIFTSDGPLPPRAGSTQRNPTQPVSGKSTTTAEKISRRRRRGLADEGDFPAEATAPAAVKSLRGESMSGFSSGMLWAVQEKETGQEGA